MPETSANVVQRYLEDAFAAEKNLEAQLESFAAGTPDAPSEDIFRRLASEARIHAEKLSDRLTSLGASAPAHKGFLAQLFTAGLGSTKSEATEQLNERDLERLAQDLITAFTAINSNLAIFESLATMAEAAGDPDTASLVRSIQNEEKIAAEQVWHMLPEGASAA